MLEELLHSHRHWIKELERRVKVLEETKQGILECLGDQTAYGIKLEMRVRSLEETNKDARPSDRDIVVAFLKRHPDLKFTIATIEVNTGLSQKDIRYALELGSIYSSITKTTDRLVGIPYWQYDSNSQDVDTPQ